MESLKVQHKVVKELIINSLLASQVIVPEILSEQLQNEIRHETVSKPIIFIGTGTCGLGAGAACAPYEIRLPGARELIGIAGLDNVHGHRLGAQRRRANEGQKE